MTGDHQPSADGESSSSYSELKPARRCADCLAIIDDPLATQCPVCRRKIASNAPLNYAEYPPFLFWTYWAPGLGLALLLGLPLMLFLVPTM